MRRILMASCIPALVIASGCTSEADRQAQANAESARRGAATDAAWRANGEENSKRVNDAAREGAQTAELIARPDTSAEVMAYPRLAPATPFADKINAALARIEKTQGGEECTTSGGPAYTRSIEVTMQGPRFVSFVVSEEWMCGAHPEEQRSAFVYDLTTGSPVDWTKILPSNVVGKASVSDGLVRVGTLSSAALRRAYIAGQDAPADCKDVYPDTEFHFLLWPDARRHALVIDQNDLPHGAAACGGPVALSSAELKALGVGGPLLDALMAGKPTDLASYAPKP